MSTLLSPISLDPPNISSNSAKREKLIPSVSTLLIIAGQEPGEEIHFGDLLMDQVKKIKKDIEDGEQLLAIGGGVGGMIGGAHDQEGAGGAGGYPPEEAEMLRGAGVGVQVDAGEKVFGKRL